MSLSDHPLVIIPTYNEAENIGALLSRILALPSRFEVLVVDDGSPDGTSDIVKQMKNEPREGTRIHLLCRGGKLGLGTAYIEGFQWALARNYPFICQMDSDFSHDPDDLERFLATARNADLVLGTRYVPGGATPGWPLRRRVLSRGANLLARALTGVPMTDLTGGFKCYRRETLTKLDLTNLHSSGYTFQIETTVHVFRLGGRVSEIPIVFRERTRGKSKIASLSVTLETLWLLLRLALKRT